MLTHYHVCFSLITQDGATPNSRSCLCGSSYTKPVVRKLLLNVSFCPCDCFVFHHGLTLVIVFQCFVLYFGDSFFRHATPPLVSCADGEKSTIPSSLAVQDHANTRTAKHPTRANACVVHNWCAPAALGLFAAAPAIRAAQNARLASMVAPAVAGPWIKVALARV